MLSDARGTASGVRAIWSLLAGLAAALVFLGIILAIAFVHGQQLKHDHLAHVSLALLAAGLVVFGGVMIGLARRNERPLDGSSDAALVTSYRRRLFAWVGFGEAPAFVGIVLSVATGHVWFYPIGAVFAFVAYIHVAPTRAHLERDQAALRRSGSECSLVDALSSALTSR